MCIDCGFPLFSFYRWHCVPLFVHAERINYWTELLKSTFCLSKNQQVFKNIWLWNLRKSGVKIFGVKISADIIKHWHPSLSRSKIDFWGVHLGGGTPKLRQNICLLNICWYHKTLALLSWAVQILDFWGVHLGGPWGGGTPKLCQNICLLNICWYHKTLAL